MFLRRIGNQAAQKGNPFDELRQALQDKQQKADGLDKWMKVVPVNIAIPDELRTAIADHESCQSTKHCLLFYSAGATEAVQLFQACETCEPSTVRYAIEDGKWVWPYSLDIDALIQQKREARHKAIAKAIGEGKTSIRDVKRRQVFVGDEPVGDLFE